MVGQITVDNDRNLSEKWLTRILECVATGFQVESTLDIKQSI